MKTSAWLAGCAALLLAGEAIAAPLSGGWAGEYTCAQGLTSITLELREAKAGDVRAVATFYENAKNPGVPSGCFTLQGRYEAKTGKLLLKQVQWIQRPDTTWYMIDLDGRLDKSGQTYTGDVRFPIEPGACTTFRIHRVARAPHPPGACGDALTS